MESHEEHGRKPIITLSDNTIVNINGVQARLVVDHASGGIKVIPLGGENAEQGFSKTLNIPVSTNFNTQIQESSKPCLENAEAEDWSEEDKQSYSTTDCPVSRAQSENLPPDLSMNTPPEPPEQPQGAHDVHSKPAVINEPRSEPSRISNVLVSHNFVPSLSAANNSTSDVTLAKKHCDKHCKDMSGSNLEVEMEIDLSGQPAAPLAYTEDGLSGSLDRHSEGDAMEQDMLEQLLSSVTRDLQYIGAATNEVPALAIGDQSSLFLTSSRLSFLRSVPPAESLFPDFHLPKQTLYMTQIQEACDSERPPDKGEGPSPEEDFPSWQFTADDVELMTCPPRPSPNDPTGCGPSLNLRPSTTNQCKTLQNISHDVISRAVQEQVKKRGRQPKVPRTFAYGQDKLKRLQPKPALHTVILINTPVIQRQLYTGGPPVNILPAAVPSASLAIPQSKKNEESAKEDKIKNKLEIQNRVSVAQESCQQLQVEALTTKMTRKSITNQPKEKDVNFQPDSMSQLTEETTALLCNVCNASFPSGSVTNFISHFLSHPTACVICKETFDNETDLFQHLCGHKVRLIHDYHGAVEFRCEICQSQFLHASNVQRHLVCVHGMKADSSTDSSTGSSGIRGEGTVSKSTNRERHKQVMCHQCGKQLGSKSLSVHLKLHCHANNPDRNTSPVLCFECNGLFLNLLTFKKHLQTTCRAQVSDNDPDNQRLTVNCPLCRKVVSLSSVATHQRLYCPAAPPTREPCPQCGAILRHKHSLRNHLRWHCKHNPDADSPTRCVCGKTFRNFKAFQSHYQNHCPGKLVPQPTSTSGVGLGRK